VAGKIYDLIIREVSWAYWRWN